MNTTTQRTRVGGAKRTGEIFIDRGILTRAQLDAALAHQSRHGGRLAEIFTDRKSVV